MDRISLQEERLMHRFYADPDRSDEQSFVLSPEDTLHAAKVLRMRPGDHAEVVFHETRFRSRIEILSEDSVRLVPVGILPSTEPSLSVTLFQGLPKSDKMDWIVQKAVELGAVRIVPVSFSRSVTRLNEKDSARKQQRWQKIAREAGKQSGRCRIPEVLFPVPFRTLPDLFRTCDCIAVPWEECSSGGPLSFYSRHPSLSSLGIVIGPEGGIAPEEMHEIMEWGGEAITLGKRILRTETAGLSALSVFLGLYGEME